jgi:hypothetical protein
VPHDVRDLVVDFVRCWSEKTEAEIGAGRFIHWLGVRASKFYDWRERYGRINEHNGWIPRDFWLQPWEKQSIIRYYLDHPHRRVPAVDVHDAGCGCCGRQSIERLASPPTSRVALPMEG